MEETLRLPQSARTDAQSSEKPSASRRAAAFSDPNALRFYIRLTTIILALAGMLVVSVGVNFLQYFRGPALAFGMQKPNGDIQWTSYNGRAVESGDNSLKVQPDVIQDGDKTFYAGEYARLLYAPDPSTRGHDVERALRMMVEDNAKKLIGCLNRGCEEYDLNLDRQRAESWQAVWTEQEKRIDRNDPYTVHVIGLQQMTKLVKGVVQKETKQISLSIKLVKDPIGRHDRNLRNGVQVESFEYKVISSSAQ